MNRLKDYFGDPPEPDERYDDYFVIGTVRCSYAVSQDTAIEIERWLDHQPPPRWVVFRDLAGSRHRILADHINRVTESTAAQRAADRAFDRARRLEEKMDRRPWEEDD
jgi:hypothetical protein